MSGLDFVNTIQPQTDINALSNRQFQIWNGSNWNMYKRYTATSFANNQINFNNCDPPNADKYVCRDPILEVTAQIDITGTSAGAGVRLVQAAGLRNTIGAGGSGTIYADCPRANPIQGSMSNGSTTLNNDTISVNVGNFARIIPRFHQSKDLENLDFGMSPSMPDNCQQYSDYVGFNRSVMAGQGDNVVQDPRGGFYDAVITANTSLGGGDSARIIITSYEPIPFAPYKYGKDSNDVGFIQLKNWSALFVLGGRNGLGSAWWSHANVAGAGTLTNISVTILDAAIHFRYLTPNLVQKIPREVYYNYYDLNYNPSPNSLTVNSGGSQTFQFNNIQLGYIPEKFYLWLDKRNSDFSAVGADTDTYMRIDNINIEFNGRNGILASMLPIDLYRMSRGHGLNYSWSDWNRRVGSVLCVSFGGDVPLSDLETPGKGGNYQLSFQVTATNISDTNWVPQLNCLIVSNGYLLIRDQVVYRSVGFLDEKTIMSVKDQEPIPATESRSFGGSFWDDVWSVAKKLIRPVITVAENVVPAQYQPVIKGLSDVARSHGLGMSGGRMLTNQELRNLR